MDWSNSRRHVVAVACSAAFFMEFLDLTVINIALPTLGSAMHAAPTKTHWVGTAYVLAVAACVLASGWAQDRWGARRVFGRAVGLFTLASVACGMATSLPILVIMRIIQGLAGGMMSPVGFTLVLRTYPDEERGRVAGYMLIPAFLAMVAGPSVGGVLLEWASWPWIFYLNVPIGIVTCAVVYGLVPDLPPVAQRRLDVLGLVLSAIGLVGLLAVLSLVGERGQFSLATGLLLLASCLALGLFLYHEGRVPTPLVDLTLFHDRLFAAGAWAQVLLVSTVTGSIMIFAFFQDHVLASPPIRTGAFCAIPALAYAAMAPIATRLVDRFGDGLTVLCGIALFAATLALLTRATVLQAPPLLITVLIVRGIGMGLCLPTSWTKAFRHTTPDNMGQASAVMSALIQLANGIGLALAAVLLRHGVYDNGHLFATAFGVFTFIAILALGAGWVLAMPSSTTARLKGRPIDPGDVTA